MPSLPALSLLVLECMCVLISFSLAFFSLRFSGFSVYRELRESSAWEWRENDQFPLSDELKVQILGLPSAAYYRDRREAIVPMPQNSEC